MPGAQEPRSQPFRDGERLGTSLSRFNRFIPKYRKAFMNQSKVPRPRRSTAGRPWRLLLLPTSDGYRDMTVRGPQAWQFCSSAAALAFDSDSYGRRESSEVRHTAEVFQVRKTSLPSDATKDGKGPDSAVSMPLHSQNDRPGFQGYWSVAKADGHCQSPSDSASFSTSASIASFGTP